MDTIVTPGLVLKETRYKESDRIITLLTPGLGVISALSLIHISEPTRH